MNEGRDASIGIEVTPYLAFNSSTGIEALARLARQTARQNLEKILWRKVLISRASPR